MKRTVATFIKTASFTLTANDSGKHFILDAVDLVATLPATAAGLNFTFTVKTISDTTGASLSPVAADKIMGAGVTAADDKDLINTAATDAIGDTITLLGDGVDGWIVINKLGTWAREA